MKTIWKFPIDITEDVQELDMPRGAKPLSVDVQPFSVEGDGGVMMWALVDPSAPQVARTVKVLGTGDAVSDHPGEFVGSVLLGGGAMVWHVFIVPEEGHPEL